MKNQNDKLVIRKTSEEDIPLILLLINELAEYEKLTNSVTVNENLLRKNLFGERKYAEVIFAEYEGNLAGQALFFYNYSTFKGKPGIYLEDLYVKPAFRNKGIGKALFKYLIDLAKNSDCGRIEWVVLNWNSPAIEFYKNLDAKPMEDWMVFRLSEENF